MINKTDDLRIINTQELISPKDIISELSPSKSGIDTIIKTRSEIKDITEPLIKNSKILNEFFFSLNLWFEINFDLILYFFNKILETLVSSHNI